MVQFKIRSGKKAGTTFVTRRFPVLIGRSPVADLQIQDDGVWDQHFQVDFHAVDGFILKPRPDALVTVNGEPARQIVLRNGDVIEIGSLKMQFWLRETRQAGLRVREWLTWAAVAAISLGQIGLIYWFLP
jgi:predicted component of type VI protein secretion system